MMDAVFADYRETHPTHAAAGVDHGLWSQLSALGLVRLTGTETTGGSGAGWYESAQLHAAAVRHGVRTPLAEHDLLACWLLEAVGMDVGHARRTICVIAEDGVAERVPWAADAERVVMLWRSGDGDRMADVDVDQLTITPGTNLIGEPRDEVRVAVDRLTWTPVSPTLAAQLQRKSALLRAIQVCAALDSIVELSIQHATSRVQFGRPLSRFQAVQNLISDIAAEAALARSATEAALASAVRHGWVGDQIDFHVAVARSCCGHAASVVVRNAHQVHGAIGTTVEHRLHEYTRAALSWRAEYGTVRHWDDRVADAAQLAGQDGLWALISN
ncbi:acyl-CoA dehydrogenase [Mycolicibacterium sp. P9-64]|nr:acyl-CoA dehydrogenase [Mycolicibacterium sp. P9-64]